MEGQHNFDSTDLVQVNNVHNLTLKGQGQWPVAGAEETVMQSTVIINCTRGRGGFIFDTGYGITIEGLTITNCGQLLPANGVILFANVSKLFFSKNSIQFMSGYGLMVKDCDQVTVTNCSYYHSVVCLTDDYYSGGGILISYNLHSQDSYSLEVTNSNMTKCCSSLYGGGIELHNSATSSVLVSIVLCNLVFFHNQAGRGGGFSARLQGSGKVFLEIQNSLFFNCSADQYAGGAWLESTNTLSTTIRNTKFVENVNVFSSEFFYLYRNEFNLSSILLLNSQAGMSVIDNCIFSNNTGGRSVILLYQADCQVINSIISDNSMTGITAIESNIEFHGHNFIENNRYTEGAGITLTSQDTITVLGELHMINNSANNHGGTILVFPHQQFFVFRKCTFNFNGYSTNSIFFSGNKAKNGGADIYGATMTDCNRSKFGYFVHHVGHPNETSWYFNSPLIEHFHFNNTDRLSSMSSDPIMVCFCNNNNLPDCSDRTPRHIQTYPGQEINTTIATVGYYGGTSPGFVHVNAQGAKLVRYYGQKETTNCFQLHILLQNTSSTTALVDIKVEGGLQNWGLLLIVDILELECPIGFVAVGQQQCKCVRLLNDNNVQCNVSLEPYKFLRSGNSWFAYINNTQQCVTGTTSCPFGYCNQSNVLFNIMAHQIVSV